MRMLMMVGVLCCMGCVLTMANEEAQRQVRATAALEHDCPVEQVVIKRDASLYENHGMRLEGSGIGGTPGDYAYWMFVCGKKRFYRYQREAGNVGRFVDDTYRFEVQMPAARPMEPATAPPPPAPDVGAR